jgi:hypothetical protein
MTARGEAMLGAAGAKVSATPASPPRARALAAGGELEGRLS